MIINVYYSFASKFGRCLDIVPGLRFVKICHSNMLNFNHNIKCKHNNRNINCHYIDHVFISGI